MQHIEARFSGPFLFPQSVVVADYFLIEFFLLQCYQSKR